MLCLIPFLLLGITNVLTSSVYSKLELNEDKQYNLDEAKDIFHEFIQKHNRKYESYEEYEHRLQIFIRNLEKMNQWNESPTATYKVNKFSDMTNEEFNKRYTGLVLDNAVSENVVEYVPTGKAPDSLDWREKNLVTGIKDQGRCGSCFVFSAIGCIEGQYAKKHNELLTLSEQEGLDCDPNGSCGGGNPVENMKVLAAQGGCMKDSDYPYTHRKGLCLTDKRKIAVKVTGGHQLQVGDEEGLKSALAEHGPLSIALSTYDKFQGYNGGISRPDDCNATLNHALTLVGYGSENGSNYWIIKNSWGADWGEKGYIRLGREMTQCGITSYVSLALVD